MTGRDFNSEAETCSMAILPVTSLPLLWEYLVELLWTHILNSVSKRRRSVIVRRGSQHYKLVHGSHVKGLVVGLDGQKMVVASQPQIVPSEL